MYHTPSCLKWCWVNSWLHVWKFITWSLYRIPQKVNPVITSIWSWCTCWVCRTRTYPLLSVPVDDSNSFVPWQVREAELGGVNNRNLTGWKKDHALAITHNHMSSRNNLGAFLACTQFVPFQGEYNQTWIPVDSIVHTVANIEHLWWRRYIERANSFLPFSIGRIITYRETGQWGSVCTWQWTQFTANHLVKITQEWWMQLLWALTAFYVSCLGVNYKPSTNCNCCNVSVTYLWLQWNWYLEAMYALPN